MDSLSIFAPIVCGGLCVLLCRLSVISSFAIIVMGKSELVAFLMSCNCFYFVTLPHGTMCWSAVFDCGIS